MRNMRASNNIYFIILFWCLVSCGRRYKMFNMVPEEVDVTHLIENGSYKPDSCEGEIRRLIRTQNAPYMIDTPRLKNMIVQWAIDNHMESTRGLTYSFPKYKYTYFITEEPIDVYAVSFQRYLPTSEEYKLYFRTDREGKLIPGLDKNGWVTTKCD